MKFFMVALSVFARAAAAPTIPDTTGTEIHDDDKSGQFALRYVTAEGTVVSERGRLVPTPDGTGFVMILEEEVSYKGDDDQVYVTNYASGLDGTHVEGNHLPVPVTAEPVVPEPVQIIGYIKM